ncbi:hypothetical protein [Saccharothrix coeruleofusca]|uniref:Uncharacterized protein n=1 Tax=Saccharothrix coeruleofusca TaxID=33919 RepID=A0A918EHD3_9PSEU|nr:hypothetical protein [Saccharothrix coeruleofusca]MBP2339709.1 hypothetical protein [Saccharothrix coeruleofusca]GGP80704.1 hypothetical protein GCM10010185_63240 [Saccharothrix coeruleofusca]
MDEQKLAELFREAASDAPPASFDVAGVRGASHRATARRRAAVALGSGLAVVVGLGGVVAGLGGVAREEGARPAVAGSADRPPSPTLSPFGAPVEPRIDDGGRVPELSGGMPPKSIPEDSSTQGDEPTGSASPRAGGTPGGCAEVDRELAVALADEFPVAQGTQPSPAAATCPDGARGASYLVRDGNAVGTVSVIVVPPDVLAAATLGSPQARESRKPARGGGTVHVISEPATGATTPPFADRVDDAATALAGEL